MKSREDDAWLVGERRKTEVDAPNRWMRVVAFGDIGLQSFAGAVAADFEVVRSADLQALQRLSKEHPNVVCLVRLASLPPDQRTEFIASIGRLSNILAIVVEPSNVSLDCEALLRAGFAGVLQGEYTDDMFLRAVRSVVDGQLWFPREIISRVLRGFLIEEDLSRLTSREIEILRLIGNGLNNQQIADNLYISRETVRWHVRGLYAKLGIKNRNGAEEYIRYLSYGKKSPHGTMTKVHSIAS